MYAYNDMNSFLFSRIPAMWFVSRREQLETHYQELFNLHTKMTKFVGGQNVEAMLGAAKSLEKLNEQIRGMEETFESYLEEVDDNDHMYNNNDFRRIRELASSTSSSLEAIAGQISWGLRADTQTSQVKRNLYPLLELMKDTLQWLERGT